MKTNMGTADRVIRLTLALVGITLIAMNIVTGVWAIVVGVLAAIFILTSMVSFCPLYALLGGERHHANDTLSVDLISVLFDEELRIELRCGPDDQRSRPGVKARSVGHFHFALGDAVQVDRKAEHVGRHQQHRPEERRHEGDHHAGEREEEAGFEMEAADGRAEGRHCKLAIMQCKMGS